MAPRKPKVGDAAIIDGAPAVIAVLDGDTVEFHDEARVALLARLAEIRAMEDPAETESAKNALMAEHEAELTALFEQHADGLLAGMQGTTPTEMKQRLVECGHTLPGGSATLCSLGQLIWVEYSKAWSCYGRLLERCEDCAVPDAKGKPSSVRSRAKIHRVQGQAYDPMREVAAHIAHLTTQEA